jgi:hypothetical protein
VQHSYVQDVLEPAKQLLLFAIRMNGHVGGTVGDASYTTWSKCIII